MDRLRVGGRDTFLTLELEHFELQIGSIVKPQMGVCSSLKCRKRVRKTLMYRFREAAKQSLRTSSSTSSKYAQKIVSLSLSIRFRGN